MAENKGIAYWIGGFVGTVVGFIFTATATTYVGLAVLKWLGLA